jgi:SurA-like protein
MHVRSVVYGIAVCVALCAGTARAETRSLDGLVVANANGEEITRGELVARLMEYRSEDALDKLINRTLLLQEAKKQNLTVADEEVSKKLTELQSRFKNEADYREFLQRSRLQESQLRDEIRHTLLIQKVALKAAPITDGDLEQYDVRMALAPDKATAEKWIKELDGGGEFRKIVAERCEDPALRQAGGRLRPFLRIEMLDIAQGVEDQKLKPGQYTKTPVQLGNKSWVILKLENRIPVANASGAEQDRLRAAVTAYRVDQWINGTRTKAAVQKKPLGEPVVAIVNGEAVKRGQLVTRLLEYYGQEALDQMVNRALLLQAAKQQGVSMTEQEADKELEKVRSGFKQAEEFQAFLTRNNLTEKQLRDELRYTELMRKVALKESPITDDDLLRYDVRMLVAPSKSAAEAWVKELDKGTDFGKMAAERTADPTGRESAGRMKPFLKVELLEIWRAVVDQKLKPGGYTKTPILLTDNSWALVKLEGVLPVSAASKTERERLTQIVTRYRMDQWLTQSRARAKIAHPVPLATVIRDGADG